MDSSPDNTQFWLTPAMKPEWPPLLKRGFHHMALDEIRQMCVTAFPSSKRRPMIMDGLERLLQEVASFGIVAEVWIDGSFLTEKLEPDDVDLVFSVAADVYDNGTQVQRDVLDMLNNTVDLKPDYHAHSFVYYEYPVGDIYENVGLRARRFWINQFGFSRRLEIKGMPVVKIP